MTRFWDLAGEAPGKGHHLPPPPAQACPLSTDRQCAPALALRPLSFFAGLFTKVTTVNELSVDTSRGEMLELHVR